jgi:hypothetical protein
MDLLRFPGGWTVSACRLVWRSTTRRANQSSDFSGAAVIIPLSNVFKNLAG